MPLTGWPLAAAATACSTHEGSLLCCCLASTDADLVYSREVGVDIRLGARHAAGQHVAPCLAQPRAHQRLARCASTSRANLAAATQLLLVCSTHRSPTRPPRAGHLELRPDAKAPGYPSAYLKENVIKARDGLVSAVGSSARWRLVTDVLP